jgi:hypothetical protein
MIMNRGKARTKKEKRSTVAAAFVNELPSNAELDELASKIKGLQADLLAGLRKNMERAIKIGDFLIEAKEILKANFKECSWLTWVEKHCDYKERMAQNYMVIAQYVVEMPDLKGKVIEMTINEAVEYLTDAHHRRLRAQQLGSEAINHDINEHLEGAGEGFMRTKERLGNDDLWQKYLLLELGEPLASYVPYLINNPPRVPLPKELSTRFQDDRDEE